MRLWTWKAGTSSGITDAPERALDHATASLAPGVTAHVELVLPALGYHTLEAFYIPMGVGFTGQLVNGNATWSAFPDPSPFAELIPATPEATENGKAASCSTTHSSSSSEPA
jgi:hypothetical protein